MADNTDMYFIEMAVDLARQGVAQNEGGPFGCVIVKESRVIGKGNNQVISIHDPTAHAEVVAIRDACRQLNSHQLEGCTIYSSCEPCPMCLGAIYWARPDRIVYACTREDAASINFDDDFIYNEINTTMPERKIPFIHQPHPAAKKVFDDWKNWEGKTKY